MRLEKSKYRDNIILKGGVLLSSIFGEDLRTTKDIDATLKSLEIKNPEKINVIISIPAGETAKVAVTALANNIGQTEELSVTNYATAKGSNTEEVTSNTITHIIEKQIIYDEQGNIREGYEEMTIPSFRIYKKFNNNNEVELHYGNDNNTKISYDNIETYKITGIAWLDENEDGIRNPSEKRLSGITAKLVDSVTGIIKDRVSTNTNGEYTFNKWFISVENSHHTSQQN